jgi:NADH:ubiquinone oxidoreductase subunit 5 (subunit L)/multisubunit Na+/H+ antiporter MnhA subunit
VSADRLAESFGPLYRAALARFWIDDAALGVYRYAVLGGSRAIGWTDRYLVDGVLNAISDSVVTLSDRLRRVQTGRAQDYVYGVAVGVLILVIWIGWPR